MNNPSALPLWVAFLVAFFLVGGAALALIGSVGLFRLKSFYQRVHAPTLGSTLGVGGVLIASIIFFSITRTRPAVHEIVIAVFLIVTTPVTLLLLVRAALHRDRAKGRPDVPGAITFADGGVHLSGDNAVSRALGSETPEIRHMELVTVLAGRIAAGEPLETIRDWIIDRKKAGISQQEMYQAIIEAMQRFNPKETDGRYDLAITLADMISGHIAPHFRIWDTFIL